MIAISTSRNSQNIINAIEESDSMNIKCIALTGKDNGKLSNLKCEIFNVDSTNTARIQETHILIGHIICSYIEDNI